MKILLLLIILLTASIARENPFETLFDTPKITEEVIPLLHITTNKTFSSQKEEINSTIPTTELNSSIVTSSENNSTAKSIDINSTIATVEKKKEAKKEKKKKVVKNIKYKTIYQNYFLKVQSNYKSFKIFTKDKLLKKVRYTNPSRMTFDFDRLQHFHTKNITFNKPFAQKIKFGSHHNFYRITVELNRYKRYKLIKKPYGYLLTFY